MFLTHVTYMYVPYMYAILVFPDFMHIGKKIAMSSWANKYVYMYMCIYVYIINFINVHQYSCSQFTMFNLLKFS